MVRLFYQVFAALALVSGSAAKIECITENDYFGGKGGTLFEDKVNRETNTTGIVLRSAERLDAIGIIVGDAEMKLNGGFGGKKETIDLKGKRIIAMEVHRAGNGEDKRIVFVKFDVKDGRSFQAGSEDNGRTQENIMKFEAPVEGAYLIGFVGRVNNEVDALGGIWLDSECAERLKKDDSSVSINQVDFSNAKVGVSNDDDDDAGADVSAMWLPF
ncbi:hypothetical protein KXD40_005580 [Peronospora effusa]|nr:hypothetical protein KXD40_005583 [Peronospora effusa]UIZ27665.1 hypothetical protein KXD40_005580 [Peronospora effusa]